MNESKTYDAKFATDSEQFQNVHKFEKWLLDNLRYEAKKILEINTKETLMSYLSDLVLCYHTNGSTSYELGVHATKSGQPECYHYDVISDGYVIENGKRRLAEEDEEPDYWNETFIF